MIKLVKSKILDENISKNKNSKHIMLIGRGMSAEKEISVNGANQIFNSLKELDYRVTYVDMGTDIAEILTKYKPDIVYNALHGKYGEDGCLAGMLEIMGIPYTHSGVFSSALGMNKSKSKVLFKHVGLNCPEGILVNKTQKLVDDPIPRPYVIKPISQGSSIGVYIIFKEDNFKFSDYKFEYGDEVIVEKYIPGREISVTILNDQPICTTELITKNKFFDYNAKYTEGACEHLTPAPLTKEQEQTIFAMAKKAHDTLGCKNLCRVDFRFDEDGDGNFYILEVNTHPGMSMMSQVPEAAKFKGISFNQLVQIILKGASLEHSVA